MGPHRFPLACQQRPPFANLMMNALIEDKTVHIFIGRPVGIRSESQAALQHADHHLGLLPEFLFHIVNAAGVRTLDINAAVLPIDPVIPPMIRRLFDDVLVLIKACSHDVRRVGEQPGKLDIVSRRGIIPGVVFLPAFGKAVPAPDDIELYLRSDFPIDGELRDAGGVLRVNYSLYEQVDILDKRPPVDGLTGTFIERSEGLSKISTCSSNGSFTRNTRPASRNSPPIGKSLRR